MALERPRLFIFSPQKLDSREAQSRLNSRTGMSEFEMAGLLLALPDRSLSIVRQGFGLDPELYLNSAQSKGVPSTWSQRLHEQAGQLYPDPTAVLGMRPSIGFMTLLRTSESVQALTDFRLAFYPGGLDSTLVHEALYFFVRSDVERLKSKALSELPHVMNIGFGTAQKDGTPIHQLAG